MINLNKVQIHRKSLSDDYQLLVDGYIIEGSSNEISIKPLRKEGLNRQKYKLHVDVKNLETFFPNETPDQYVEIIYNLKLTELIKADIEELAFENFVKWEGFNISIYFDLDEKSTHYFDLGKKTTQGIVFYAGLSPYFFSWKFPYSWDEYIKAFFDIWNKQIAYLKTDKDHIYYGKMIFELDLRFGSAYPKIKPILNDLVILEEIENNLEPIFEIHKQVISQLIDEQYRNSLLAAFYFPEQLKIPCEQYLLYFAQFLQDLGINATSNLTEEAGKVLFSVTPTDDKEALDKIREALAIYLSLASNPIPNSTGDRTVDMVLSGARANAKHLESQLELAVAKLQFKEAALELKDATIGQNQLAISQKDETIKELQEIISRGNIFEESLEKVEINGEVIEASDLYRFSRGEDDDIEVSATPILEEANEETKVGLVKFHDVTKLKDYGVSFDLPQAIRNLMKYFNRNKNE